jgi:hypothetical protein
MDKRDTCIFYRSMYEAMQELPEAARLQLYDAIFLYSLDFKQPELTGLAKALFIAFEPVLTKGNTNYINGSKPKSKRIGSESEAKPKRLESETEAYKDKDKDKYKEKDKEKDKNKDNFKKWSQQDLIESMKPYKDKYPKELLNAFFNYWSEPLANGKMRLTSQDAWDTGRRLVTWKNRELDKKPQNAQPTKTRAQMGVKME